MAGGPHIFLPAFLLPRCFLHILMITIILLYLKQLVTRRKTQAAAWELFFSCFQSLSLFEYTNTCRPDKRDHSCFSEVRYVGAEDGTFNIMVYYTIYRGVANDWLSSNQHFKAVNFHFSDYNSSMEVQQPLIFDSGSLRDQLSPQHSGAFFHDCKQVKLHFEKYSRNTTHLLWQSRKGELCR